MQLKNKLEKNCCYGSQRVLFAGALEKLPPRTCQTNPRKKVECNSVSLKLMMKSLQIY